MPRGRVSNARHAFFRKGGGVIAITLLRVVGIMVRDLDKFYEVS